MRTAHLHQGSSEPTYRLLLNDERTVLVRIWSNGPTEVSTRETPDHIWGPPIEVHPEGGKL